MPCSGDKDALNRQLAALYRQLHEDIMREVDALFGEDTCRKIFGDIVPGIELFDDFFTQLIFNMFCNGHYILSDAHGRITDGWSNGPHPDRDTTGAICISNQGGYQFRLAPDGEENPPLYTMDGIPLYKWDGSQIVPRTEDEIAADRAAIPAPPPSPQEQLRADVDFLAALQGVML